MFIKTALCPENPCYGVV